MEENHVKSWFLRRGENRSTRGKASRCRVENQQTQPTHDVESGNRTRATFVGGECSHHCAIPAPQLELENLELVFLDDFVFYVDVVDLKVPVVNVAGVVTDEKVETLKILRSCSARAPDVYLISGT